MNQNPGLPQTKVQGFQKFGLFCQKLRENNISLGAAPYDMDTQQHAIRGPKGISQIALSPEMETGLGATPVFRPQQK